jgi:hypothetical protein
VAFAAYILGDFQRRRIFELHDLVLGMAIDAGGGFASAARRGFAVDTLSDLLRGILMACSAGGG